MLLKRISSLFAAGAHVAIRGAPDQFDAIAAVRIGNE